MSASLSAAIAAALLQTSTRSLPESSLPLRLAQSLRSAARVRLSHEERQLSRAALHLLAGQVTCKLKVSQRVYRKSRSFVCLYGILRLKQREGHRLAEPVHDGHRPLLQW